jgi:NAD(P)-dependent dehydrogenase (short-subunit alcohol dehydrogenase family)
MRKSAVQTALVTGAGRRIGRAIALELGRRGWRIGVHYHRSETDAEAVCDTIRSLGGDAVALPCDLSRADDVADLVPRCAEALGAPTCLVNNASEFLLDTVETMSAASWDLHMNVNLRAPIVLARAMAAGLPEGAEGNVINIVDQRVWRLTPEFFSYTLSKSALWTATRTMAQALAPRVRVNAIGPGPVLRSVHQTEDEFAEECRATLLKRGTSPDEVASTVAYILATPAMTGQMIALDGGQHLIWNDRQA